MIKRRDLGQPLALAGAGVVVAAVIAGFIAVGGPGDARDRRLDQQHMNRLYEVASMAHCAFVLEGKAPADMGEMRTAIFKAAQKNPDAPTCGRYTLESNYLGAEYSRIADDHIRLCGEFRRPSEPEDPRRGPSYYQTYDRFPEFTSPRPAGRHCYDIQLLKPEGAAN